LIASLSKIHLRDSMIRGLRLSAAATIVAVGALVAQGSQRALAAPLPYSQTFYCTGGEQTFAVPNGLTTAHVEAVGGRGGYGDGYFYNGFGNPGYGGDVSGDLTVTPGTTLYVEVGCNGANGTYG